MFCQRCGAQFPENTAKCPHCGAEYDVENTAVPVMDKKTAPKISFFTKKKIIITLLIAVILIAGSITGAVILSDGSSISVSTFDMLQLADRYLKEINYEQAIVEFRKILEIEPKNAEAYIGLAEAYVGLGDTDKAIEVLERGQKNTDSEKIENKLKEIKAVSETSDYITEETIVTTSEDFTITNESVLPITTESGIEIITEITIDTPDVIIAIDTQETTVPSVPTTLERVEYKHGKIEGNIYTNDLISVKIDLGKDWKYGSDSEVAKKSGIIDFSKEEIDKVFKNNGTLFEMYAINYNSDSIVTITFEDLESTNSSYLDEKGYVDIKVSTFYAQIEEMETFNGITYYSIDYDKNISFAGKELPCIQFGYSIDKYRYQYEIYKKVGQYMCTVIVTAPTAEAIEDILRKFTAISDLPVVTTKAEPENVNLETVIIGETEYSIADTTELFIYNKSLTDEDVINIGKLTNLTHLRLAGSEIHDIAPFANLTKLTYLELQDNQITDISPLANLTELTYLYLFYNQIVNISALSNLNNLVHLEISDNQISDITPIYNLSNLTDLDLSSNEIIDITLLYKLANLKNLDLSYNEISDITSLANLTNLESLSLYGTQVTKSSAKYLKSLLPNCDIYPAI